MKTPVSDIKPRHATLSPRAPGADTDITPVWRAGLLSSDWAGASVESGEWWPPGAEEGRPTLVTWGEKSLGSSGYLCLILTSLLNTTERDFNREGYIPWAWSWHGPMLLTSLPSALTRTIMYPSLKGLFGSHLSKLNSLVNVWDMKPRCPCYPPEPITPHNFIALDLVTGWERGREWVHWAGGHLIAVNWDNISVTAHPPSSLNLNTLTAASECSLIVFLDGKQMTVD